MSENLVKNDKNEVKRRYNQPFIKAFEYCAKILTNGNYGMMAQMIGTNGGHYSDWKAGRKRVSDYYFKQLITVSQNIPGGPICDEFLRGNCDIMLYGNVTDDELARIAAKRTNPDYDVIRQKEVEKKQVGDIVDMYSTLIKEVEYLRKQLTEEIADVHSLRVELTTALHHIRGQYQIPENQPLTAAEKPIKIYQK